MDDDAADELAVVEVLVALVDLVQGVAAGDEFVELELARGKKLRYRRIGCAFRL